MNQINEMSETSERICPRCHSPKMKSWDELDGDRKFLIERLPASAEFTPAERKKHRFCVQCFYEKTETGNEIV